jgi:hypothetical protein
MHPIMERKIFTSEEADVDKERKKDRRLENGYFFGAHAKEDAIRNKDKRLPVTKSMCA